MKLVMIRCGPSDVDVATIGETSSHTRLQTSFGLQPRYLDFMTTAVQCRSAASRKIN